MLISYSSSIKKTILVLSSIIFVFVFTETFLHFFGAESSVNPRIIARSIDRDIEFPFMEFDKELFWRLKPGFRGSLLGKPVSINSLGLRGAETGPLKGKAVICCFGDSITFGYGVGDSETYPFYLESMLNTKDTVVLNCGVTGYTTYQVLKYLKRLSGRIKIDTALFLAGWNDATGRPVDDYEYADQINAATSGNFLSRHSLIFRKVKNAYIKSVLKKNTGYPVKNRISIGQYKNNVISIINECKSKGITPVFIDIPSRRDSLNQLTKHEYSITCKAVCSELNIKFIEIKELSCSFSTAINAGMFIDICHLNAKGNKYLASILYDKINFGDKSSSRMVKK